MKSINIFRALIHLPALLVDAQVIGTDVEQVQSDPKIVAELAKCPILIAVLAEIGAEWRAVENDVTGPSSGSIWQKFPKLQRLLTDAGLLTATVRGAQDGAFVTAELAKCPNVKDALTRISAELRKIESDAR